jgi:hypothetical protein
MSMITTTDVTSDTFSGYTTHSVEVTVDLSKTYYVSVTVGPQGTWNGDVRVLHKNASHRAYRGVGRGFAGFQTARDGYKSTAAKIAIDEAETVLMVALSN